MASIDVLQGVHAGVADGLLLGVLDGDADVGVSAGSEGVATAAGVVGAGGAAVGVELLQPASANRARVAAAAGLRIRAPSKG
jgi:hypothetical protein